MKQRHVAIGLALLAIFGASSVPAVQAAEERSWRLLFNENDLEGWEQHGGAAKYWAVGGVIVGHSVPNTSNSFLCTKERFRDFELVLEVNVDKGLNSGVQVRSNVKENDRVYGPQVEIEWAPGASAYIYGEATGRGWLSQDRSKQDVFKNGDWNEYRVLCQGNNIKTWLNGEPMADLTDDESSREGFIGLQVHGVGKRSDPLFVRWRNIRIRVLD